MFSALDLHYLFSNHAFVFNTKYKQFKDFLSQEKNNFTDAILHNFSLHQRLPCLRYLALQNEAGMYAWLNLFTLYCSVEIISIYLFWILRTPKLIMITFILQYKTFWSNCSSEILWKNRHFDRSMSCSTNWHSMDARSPVVSLFTWIFIETSPWRHSAWYLFNK